MLCAVAAPGFRDAGNNGLFGALGNVGNNGYNWSSAVSGTNAMNLNFNSSWLNPSNTNNRGHGFQVRCLQAFIGILIYRHHRGYGDWESMYLFFILPVSTESIQIPEYPSALPVADSANDKFSNLLICAYTQPD